MPDEKVTFGRDGSYQIGAPVQEMDVEQKRQKGPQAGESISSDASSAQVSGTTSAAKSATPKKFDMSKLRRSAKKAAPKAESEEQPPAPKVESKPEPVPTPEPQSAPEPAPAPEPEPEPTPVPPPAPAPELTPEPAPAPEPPKAFSLSQLNRKPPQPTAEDAPKETPEITEMSLDSTTRKEPEVKPEPVPEPTPAPAPQAKEESQVSEMKLDSTKAEPALAPAEPEPETAATAPDFIQNTLEEFLAFTQLDANNLSAFAKKVAQASVRGGTIWQSKQFELLRAYSCTVAQGRSIPKTAKYMVTFGWDVHITTCYVDQNFVISDGSSNLTCAGICASVQGTPVALSLERKRSAIVC